MIDIYISAAIRVFFLMNVGFLLAAFKKRNDIADVIWPVGFLLVTSTAIGQATLPLSNHSAVVLFMIAGWAFRLLFILGPRVLQSSEEDFRYQDMRRSWGKRWLLHTYFKVFMLQGVFLLVICAPIVFVLTKTFPKDFGFLTYLGLVLWFIGFGIQGISDNQLRDFRAKPNLSGKILQTGLWAWSRHPNYFGEVLQWWAFFVMALALSGGWMTIVSPLLITFLILKVSGVPLLEARMANKKGYAEYRARTSAFFPRPPKKM